jgi:hypothetical protein|tara:strand:+ start:1153 stop:1674 length:522 start_codon:yes stop_codon:yes gene_type:complete
MKPEIIDNFLSDEVFKNIQNIMLGNEFHWCYNSVVVDPNIINEDFYFVHPFYKEYNPASNLCEILDPVIEILDPISIYRIQANLYPRDLKHVMSGFHTDIGDLHSYPEKLKQWTTAILYMNTNNGRTDFKDGIKVNSVENRLVVFPSNLEHTIVTCTDKKIRVVINFNYFSKH